MFVFLYYIFQIQLFLIKYIREKSLFYNHITQKCVFLGHLHSQSMWIFHSCCVNESSMPFQNDKNNHLQTLSSSEKETTHAFLSANDGDDKNKLLNKHCAQFKFTETHRHSAEMTSVWPRINSIPPRLL